MSQRLARRAGGPRSFGAQALLVPFLMRSRRLLSKIWPPRCMCHVQEEQQQELIDKISKGEFTLR